MADLPWYMVALMSAAVGLVAFAAGRSAGWREGWAVGRHGALMEMESYAKGAKEQ